jgi:hypothetical protein
MAINRDNDEERMARIEHILARLADGRGQSQRIQAEARRVLSEIHRSRERRSQLVERVKAVLHPSRARKKR